MQQISRLTRRQVSTTLLGTRLYMPFSTPAQISSLHQSVHLRPQVPRDSRSLPFPESLTTRALNTSAASGRLDRAHVRPVRRAHLHPSWSMECLMLPVSLRFHEFSSVSHITSYADPWVWRAAPVPGDWYRSAPAGSLVIVNLRIILCVPGSHESRHGLSTRRSDFLRFHAFTSLENSAYFLTTAIPLGATN